MIRTTPITLAVFLLVFLLIPIMSHAAEAALSTDTLSIHMERFWQQSALAIQHVIAQPELQQFGFMLWSAFSLLLIGHVLVLYILGGSHINALIQTVLLIATVRIFMNHFDEATSAVWSASEGLSLSIQKAVLGTSDLWFAGGFIQDVMRSISVDWFSASFLIQIICAGLLLLLCIALSIMAFIATIWSLWGYVIAKMIGLFFLPFLLIERLSWLFDGWLRFFIGFLIYGIIARINIILGVICLKSFLNLPSGQLPTGTTFFYSTDRPDDIIALACLMAVCLAGLASSGRFAGAIVSGTPGLAYGYRQAISGLSRLRN